jgi:natural product precursor
MRSKGLKLNQLSNSELREGELQGLKGGKVCGCSCRYASSGGSSTGDNGCANVKFEYYSAEGENEWFVTPDEDKEETEETE